jgi:two-component system, cell cycle sensor histidine kinase and response regulator CckA
VDPSPLAFPRPDYRAAFDSAPGNYLLLDPSLTIVGVTEAYLSATMTVREDILGRGLFEVFPDNPDDPAADGVRNLRTSLSQVLSTKRPHRMALQKYDIRRPEREGGGFEERYWSPLNSPVLGPDGEVKYIIHWVEDVTEFVRLKQEMQREQQVRNEELCARAGTIEAEAFLRVEAIEANQRLSESERRYRFLADAVPQLIWTADPEGLIDYCNQRWFSFTNLPFGRLQEDGWQETLHPDDRARTSSAWSEAVRLGSDRFQIEHRMRHHDGTWRWMLMTALPFLGPADEVQRWFGSCTDIHDRVMADEQLREAQRLQAVGKLAGGMAHEVNNMMTAVVGFGELVAAALEQDHPLRADVREMIKAGTRAAEVTRQLLAFSRQQVLKPVVLDLNVVAQELTPVLRQLLGSDRRLDLRLAPSPVRVTADRSQLEQVLINLVANARDATTTDSVVCVETEAVFLDGEPAAPGTAGDSEAVSGCFVRLAVRDNGVGMAPAVVARAFEPFFTTKPVGQGTGLGLSMVHGIAKQSGGFARIDSVPAEGTVVSIHLPRVEAEPTVTEPTKTAPRGLGEKILVVEDQAVVGSLVRRSLEASGYTVYQAPNGAAGLAFLAAHPGLIDLVLTDIVMPRMNGSELAAKIGQRYPHIPVLFMSGYGGDDILQRGLTLAGAPFIAKPFTPEALAAAVHNRLKQARQLLADRIPSP